MSSGQTSPVSKMGPGHPYSTPVDECAVATETHEQNTEGFLREKVCWTDILVVVVSEGARWHDL